MTVIANNRPSETQKMAKIDHFSLGAALQMGEHVGQKPPWDQKAAKALVNENELKISKKNVFYVKKKLFHEKKNVFFLQKKTFF